MITLRIGSDGFPRPRAQATYARSSAVHCVIEIRADTRAVAPPPRALPVASGLTAPISDGRRADKHPLPSIEARRGFSLGNGYLPGQIIDRAI